MLGGSVEHESAHLMVVDGSIDFRRLALTRFVGEVLAECDVSHLGTITPMSFKSFAVKVTRVLGAGADRDEVIRVVASRVRGKVDLKHPSAIIHVFVEGSHAFVTRELFEFRAKELACRRPQARPFFSPTSLQPQLARALINLSGAGREVLDPFCGTGGILLEACSLGLRATGVELDARVFEGCNENLWFFGCDASVFNEDFLDWRGGRFEAIVTDLPYGKSTALFGKALEDLYAKSFAKMREHSSKAVIVSNKDVSQLLACAGWRVRDVFPVYVHKTMTRFIHVCCV